MDEISPAYDERGLVPCIVQDWRTGEVLTLAYMNEEALERTRATGELHLWSRSRDELWHKGATSGNTQAVKALRLDCDGDALLALVEPAGPAGSTRARMASPSQSRRSALTACVLPEVAPLCHSSFRLRLHRCSSPVSRVRVTDSALA